MSSGKNMAASGQGRPPPPPPVRTAAGRYALGLPNIYMILAMNDLSTVGTALRLDS